MQTDDDPSKLLRLLADLFRQMAGRHGTEVGDVLRDTSYQLDDTADQIDRLDPPPPRRS